MKTFTVCKSLLLVLLISIFTCSSWAQSIKPGQLFKKLAVTESNFAEKVTKLRRHAYATEFSFVEFNDFLQTMRDGRLRFTLPGLKDSITAVTAFEQIKTPQEYTWTGNILAGKDEGILGEVILHYDKGQVSGSITYKDEAYQIQPLSESGKTHALFRLDKRYKEGPLCGNKEAAVKQNVAPKQDKGARRDPCGGGNIRVFFFFTQAAQATGLNVNATINSCIAEWNSAVSVSGASTQQMQLAGSELLPGFIEGASTDIDIANFTNFTTFPQVSARRDDPSIRADIMVLLCEGNWNNARGQVVDIGPNVNFAFMVVGMANAINANHTFTHEACHMFGCRHEANADPNSQYAHGFRLYNVSQPVTEQITVMHTNVFGADTRLNRLSNPNVLVNGSYTGSATANNARVVTENTGQVQNFRVPPTTEPLRAFIDGPYEGEIYCGLYTWEATYQCGNEGAPVSFEWAVSVDDGYTFNGASPGETFTTNLYAYNTWIRLLVYSNGQVTPSYQRVVGRQCGGRKGAPDALADAEISDNTELALLDVSPNPASADTEVSFYLKQAQQATLAITDLTGRPVKVIKEQYFEAGTHTYQLGKVSFGAGIYLLNVSTNTTTKSKRIAFQ